MHICWAINKLEKSLEEVTEQTISNCQIKVKEIVTRARVSNEPHTISAYIESLDIIKNECEIKVQKTIRMIDNNNSTLIDFVSQIKEIFDSATKFLKEKQQTLINIQKRSSPQIRGEDVNTIAFKLRLNPMITMIKNGFGNSEEYKHIIDGSFEPTPSGINNLKDQICVMMSKHSNNLDVAKQGQVALDIIDREIKIEEHCFAYLKQKNVTNYFWNFAKDINDTLYDLLIIVESLPDPYIGKVKQINKILLQLQNNFVDEEKNHRFSIGEIRDKHSIIEEEIQKLMGDLKTAKLDNEYVEFLTQKLLTQLHQGEEEINNNLGYWEKIGIELLILFGVSGTLGFVGFKIKRKKSSAV